jgi:hypothetical protein
MERALDSLAAGAVRPPSVGWVVQIGEGTIGREKSFLELNDPGAVTPLETKGTVRLSFRARRAKRVTAESILSSPSPKRKPGSGTLIANFVHVFSIVDQYGERRDAIFVWRREDDSDKEGPDAIYWLKISR